MHRRASLLTLLAVSLAAAFLVGRWTAAPQPGGSSPPPAGSADRQFKGAGTAESSAESRRETRESPRPPSSTRHSADVLARLAAMTVASPGSIRQLLVELEALKSLGPAALPGIRDFLATGRDTDYDASIARTGFRDGRVPTDFVVPPSLRLALLEVAKNIGGTEAVELLAGELKRTGRGIEAAYIAGALQQLAPGQFQEVALAAARDLLAMPLGSAAQSPLDRADREYLYGMLAAAGDRAQLAPAQAQLVLPTGAIDRGALRFLQQTLGEGALEIVEQAWNDPRVAANQRQPLAALALSYVGGNGRAEQFWERAINDPQMPPDARKDLIEDLNQEGFANVKQLTAADLPLIEKRLALIDRLAPQSMDAINRAAFAEARKDLVNMRAAVLGAAPPKK